MGLGRRYSIGIGFGVSVTVSAFPITITMLAAFAAFATFPLAISREGIVPWSLLGVVGGPGIIPMIRVGNERLTGRMNLGLLIAI
jgi:hypothetical protein